jgi:hypothetical protein
MYAPELGKVYAYSTNPLSYLQFIHLEHEKDGEFEPLTYYGVELEVVPKRAPITTYKKIHSALGADFAILKADSSLPEKGVEIVTAPATLDAHKKLWKPFFDSAASSLVESYASSSCGMHVHINNDSFANANHLGKMIAFYNCPVNRQFITRIAGRESGYARFNSAYNAYSAKLLLNQKSTMPNAYMGGGERRSAVNVTSKGTVEIRIFKGNVARIGFFKNLEFVDSVKEYSKLIWFSPLSERRAREVYDPKREETHSYSLLFKDYLAWLERDKTGRYTNLKLWLSKNDLTKPIQLRYTEKTPVDKIITDENILAVA